MHPALWISKTGLDAQQTDIAVISNNLANASTVGFKKSRAVFEDLLYQNINQPGGRSSADTEMPNGLMVGAGTKVVATQKKLFPRQYDDDRQCAGLYDPRQRFF
jgi:flagellar basal-body rod protein FlgG